MGKYTEPKATSVTKDKSGGSKPRKPLNSVRNGLSIEAYRLSDQANRLIKQGILTAEPGAVPTDSADSARRRPSPPSSSRNNNSSSKPSGSGSETGTAQRRRLHLAKQVLFKNQETTVVEPLLVAVPLPILQKLPSSATSRSSGGKDSVASESSIYTFQHLFPTESELRLSVGTAALSRKLILQLVLKMEKGLPSELKDKLRDIHLLRYLGEYFDPASVRSIAQCVVSGSSAKLPPQVLMSIQMVKPILQDSGTDSDSDSDSDEL